MTYQMGQQLGNYRLVRQLGSGGFAEVYLAKHIYLHTQAAIKVLQIQLTEHILENFLKEARIIANLEHANIVRVLEFGIEQHRPYLVMNYAPKGTLRQRYPQGRQLAPTTVLALLKQVVAALEYAHARKIIHRDVKPENMLLSANDALLLSDFGLALEGYSVSYGQPADQAGTMRYMAPEQFRGQPCAASDQYSLGVVVYEWLSGAVPFAGTGLAVAVQHAHQRPVPLHERVPALPVNLSNVVMRTLKKDPKARFAHIQEFAAAFGEACHQHATLFSIAESAHPLSAAIVEAQSAHISADTLARLPMRAAKERQNASKALPFNTQGTQQRGLSKTIRKQHEQEEETPSAEQTASTITPDDLTLSSNFSVSSNGLEKEVAATGSEVDVYTRNARRSGDDTPDMLTQPLETTEETSPTTSDLTLPSPGRPPRKRALLYGFGLGGLGLVLCLGGFWEMRGMTPQPQHPTQQASVNVTRTIHPTKAATKQKKAGKPASKPAGATPNKSQPAANAIDTWTRPQSATASTPVTAPRATPTHASAPGPTPTINPTPEAAPTPSASPTPTWNHHGRPLTVQIVNAPESVQNGSTVSIQVTTSQSNCYVRLRVIYSGSSEPFRSQMIRTDSDGNGAITWNVETPGQSKYALATLVVTAYDRKNRPVFSLPVIVQVI